MTSAAGPSARQRLTIDRRRLSHRTACGRTEPVEGTALRAQADALADVPTLSRTCLQDALPSSLGVLFGGYAALLQRRTGELERAVHVLRAVALGGTVIGTCDGAPLQFRERGHPGGGAEWIPAFAGMTN
jgi:hypothetical protein